MLTNFHAPRIERITKLLSKPRTLEDRVHNEIEQEIRIQEKHPDTYGYVFSIMQKSA